MALGSAQAAQRAAQSILSEGRFRTPAFPDPLHAALVWLGRAAEDPLSAINGAINSLGSDFPGGVAGLWAVFALALVLFVAAASVRRARTRLERTQRAVIATRRRPGELERAAEQAERAGNWDEAVRLRFQAGLLRLAENKQLSYTETTPNHSLARKLGSEPLDRLSRRFDEIVYGGDEATAADAERQRETWSEVLSGSER